MLSNDLKHMIKDISFSPVTADENNELFLKVTEENKKILYEYIFRSNLNLITKYISTKENYKNDDVFQDACIGLYNAVTKFDVNKGYAFSTYAFAAINNSICKGRSELNTIPRAVYKQLALYDKCRINGMSDEEIAKLQEIKEPLDEIKRLWEENILRYNDPETETKRDIHEPDPMDVIVGNDTRERLIKAINTLNPLEREIIISYFAIYGNEYDYVSLSDIARSKGLSRQRIHQIKNKALVKLSKKQEVRKLYDEYK